MTYGHRVYVVAVDNHHQFILFFIINENLFFSFMKAIFIYQSTKNLK
jgi:hypothetical protein